MTGWEWGRSRITLCQEPHESDLVDKAKPVMRALALAKLHESASVRVAARLS